MKKLVLTAVFAFATLTAVNAQEKAEVKAMPETVKASSIVEAEAPVAAKQTVEAKVNQEFKKIKVEELPKAVLTTISKNFGGATIAKAYVNEKKEYKVEVAVAVEDEAKDVKMKTVYLNSNGEMLKKR